MKPLQSVTRIIEHNQPLGVFGNEYFPLFIDVVNGKLLPRGLTSSQGREELEALREEIILTRRNVNKLGCRPIIDVYLQLNGRWLNILAPVRPGCNKDLALQSLYKI